MTPAELAEAEKTRRELGRGEPTFWGEILMRLDRIIELMEERERDDPGITD